MNQEKIGKFIQERRKSKELTQIELAEKLGVSNRTISKWETGQCIPDYSIFQDLCNELDITINELLSGEKLTKENYQKRLEENIVSTIDYNNTKRNKKIKKVIIFIVGLVILYLFYKIFITYFYYRDFDNVRGEYDFPNNKNIESVRIHYNGKANTVFNDINIYIPDDFVLVTDKAKSNLVMDECEPYIKNLEDDQSFDAMVLVCHNLSNNIQNIDDATGIRSTMFPYMNVYGLLEKYNIRDTIDMIKFYESHAKFKQNIFTSSDDIKINYIARNYVRVTVPNYDNFYYLEGELRGFSFELLRDNYYFQQAIISYYTGVYNETNYSVSFHNNKEEYFNHDNSLEIINSIYRR